MAKNIIDKIWDNHVVSEKRGHPVIFAIDMHLMHEVTSPQAFSELDSRGLKIHDTKRSVATADHSISTSKERHKDGSEKARAQVDALRKNTQEAGIKMFDFESGHQGVIHVMAPELGIIQPGMTVACGDSHTATHGAFGAMAFGVGTTEVGHIMATGCILQRKPKTMKVHFKGKAPKGITAKDLILKLIQVNGTEGGTGYIFEYTGEVIEKMDMEGRMTICNMSIEAGARAGLIAPDEKTYQYLKTCPALKSEVLDDAIKYWETLKSDQDADYDKIVEIDISDMSPVVTWGTNPAQSVEIDQKIPDLDSFAGHKKTLAQSALKYVKLNEGDKIKGVKIDYVFIGSCTNGRLGDLRQAAEVFEGRKVKKEVQVYVVPGSEQVKQEAEEMGLDKVFIEAGCDWRNPGCSMCLAMNDDKVPAGKRCASTSNRNFVGRQGTGSITHLMSPQMAAYAAVKGEIADVREIL